MSGDTVLLLPPGRILTAMQQKAVDVYTENGGKKADALREAGYAPSVVDNPQRVFNSPHVMEVLNRTLGSPDKALLQLNKKLTARRVEHMTFPPFNPPKAKEHEEQDEIEGTDHSEEIRGEQMTDKDIREMFLELGYEVKKIVHGDMARHVYFFADHHLVQMEAIKKVADLYGLDAPKKMIGKMTHEHGVQSMSDLRKKMQAEGVRVINQE